MITSIPNMVAFPSVALIGFSAGACYGVTRATKSMVKRNNRIKQLSEQIWRLKLCLKEFIEAYDQDMSWTPNQRFNRDTWRRRVKFLVEQDNH